LRELRETIKLIYINFLPLIAISSAITHWKRRTSTLPAGKWSFRGFRTFLSTTYGILPLLTFQFPEDRKVTAEDVQRFQQHQKMAMVAARGFIVAYELIGNLRKADWYN
jgi:hypothetical protein